MTDQTVAAPPPAKTFPRRTRVPDWMTDAVLIATVIFGAWGVGLIVLTIVGIAAPALLYVDQKAFIKALGSTVVVALAFSQLYTMESVLGHLPRGRARMKTLLRAHRIGGRIAIALAVVIAFFCIVDVGAPTSPLRPFVHAVAGSTAFTALGIKFALIRWRPALAYDVAPWIGRLAAVCFVIIWITSGLAYLTGNL